MLKSGDIKLGDILFGPFPTEEGDKLPHPMLVLHMDERINGNSMVVSYGSSKHVTESGSKKGEFVILKDDRSFDGTGLKESTRFDLRVTTNIPVECFLGRKLGRIDLNDQKVLSRLKKAMVDA